MKILIAGGAGYIGSLLVPKLIARGFDVDVVDLCWFGNFLPPEVPLKKINLFDLNVEDMKQYDQVIFLAGISNDPMAEYSPKYNFIYNTSLPAYLCYIAKKAGVKRYIYAGSCSVYGYTVNELYNEESPTVSEYPYGISKLQGEKSVLQMQDESFSVICFRQGTVGGYSPRMRFDLVTNTMYKSAIMKNTIRLTNPSIWRPILSIKDACDAYIRAIEADHELSGVFNIASANYTLGEIGDLVKEQVEKKFNLKLTLDIGDVKDFRNYKVSIDKAINVLGFRPKNNVSTIIDDLIEQYGNFSDFENPQFYNIEMFKTVKELPI